MKNLEHEIYTDRAVNLNCRLALVALICLLRTYMRLVVITLLRIYPLRFCWSVRVDDDSSVAFIKPAGLHPCLLKKSNKITR